MKDTLFDVSPAPDSHPKSTPRRKELNQGAVIEAESIRDARDSFELPPQHPLIGTIDHTYQCSRLGCEAQCSDILEEDGREWLIACAFCSATQWVPVIKGHIQPKPKEFRFSGGRCGGMTLAEAAAEPHGLEYIAWAAENAPHAEVRAECRKHIDSAPVVS